MKHTVLIRRNTNCQCIFPKSNLNPYRSGKWKLKLLWESLLPNQNGYQWENKGQQTLSMWESTRLTDCCRSANWCATEESRVEGLKRLKPELRYDPASGHVLKDAMSSHRDACASWFIIALSTRARKWNQLRSINIWMDNKNWFIHTIGFYSAVKKIKLKNSQEELVRWLHG